VSTLDIQPPGMRLKRVAGTRSRAQAARSTEIQHFRFDIAGKCMSVRVVERAEQIQCQADSFE